MHGHRPPSSTVNRQRSTQLCSAYFLFFCSPTPSSPRHSPAARLSLPFSPLLNIPLPNCRYHAFAPPSHSLFLAPLPPEPAAVTETLSSAPADIARFLFSLLLFTAIATYSRLQLSIHLWFSASSVQKHDLVDTRRLPPINDEDAASAH
ncbi:hypothetical protein DM02DRAFT_650129 [Periconia macrospinosa]|uniref:Uncharacterized protein n=1 Tax=Periconia macrospinosa TaxID=97972 RepID=A0A2V1E6Q2_9PLEO|nr:hypothetical protein DM02DRAFT_650129 [Periconia macrospinosa]